MVDVIVTENGNRIFNCVFKVLPRVGENVVHGNRFYVVSAVIHNVAHGVSINVTEIVS